MNFQQLLENIETSPEILEYLKYEDSTQVLDDILENYNDEQDYNFLFQIFHTYIGNNFPYIRNIGFIFEKLIEEGKVENTQELEEFLIEKLTHYADKLREGDRDILSKLLVSFTTRTEEMKVIYNNLEKKGFLSVSSVGFFTKYFAKEEKGDFFIRSFLYDEKTWFRGVFISGKNEEYPLKGIQKSILDLEQKQFAHFLTEISKKENIASWIRNDNDFTDNIIATAKGYKLFSELYILLTNMLMYSRNYEYSETDAYTTKLRTIFDICKNQKPVHFYIRFFKDINYGKEGFYYFRLFDDFIGQTLQTEEDVKDLLSMPDLQENNYILGYRIFQFVKHSDRKNIIEFFQKQIGKEITLHSENQKKYLENQKKIQTEQDKEIKEEIQQELIVAKDTDRKISFKLLEFYIGQSDLFEEENIEQIITEQVKRYFEFKNLDPTRKEALESFKKTDTGHSSYQFLIDSSLETILKTAEKLGIDLSEYTSKIVGFIPFKYDGEDLKKILDLVAVNISSKDIDHILYVYNTYPDINRYHIFNLIYFYKRVKDIVSENGEQRAGFIGLFKELLEDDSVFVSDKLETLVELEELGVEKSIYQGVFDKYDAVFPGFNYYKDYLDSTGKYDFQLVFKSNELLIKQGYVDAIQWRIDQVRNGFISCPEKKGWGSITNLQSEIHFGREFIQIFSDFKTEQCIPEILELLEFTFENYKKYPEFSRYIWEGIKKYLDGLQGVSEITILIEGIGELLFKTESSEISVYFKRYIDEIDNGNFIVNIDNSIHAHEYIELKENISKVIKQKNKIERIMGDFEEKNHRKDEEIKELRERLNEMDNSYRKLSTENEYKNKKIKELGGKDIVILTEGKTDWKHLMRAWKELSNMGLLKSNSIAYDFENYVKKYEDINNLIGGTDSIDGFVKSFAELFPETLIIVIFDTDSFGQGKELRQLRVNYKEKKKRKKFKQYDYYNFKKEDEILGIENTYKNLYLFFLPVPQFRKKSTFYNKEICIEFYYDEYLLNRYQFIRKCQRGPIIHKYDKSVHLIDNIHYSFGKKDRLIFDANEKLPSHDMNGDPCRGNLLYTKNHFAEDILNNFPRNNPEYKSPLDYTWKRFLPIFKGINEIIIDFKSKL
ncbi:hypothetical protein A9Q91_01595 [Candidatus Gracilibacteria bacterium 28_42_T64]|nr:hypothetical protein A9Q91_01595 [Candidatus Gracilibacteria bacterium 28_42_T64]